jgi:hypothetical protein
VLAQQNVVSLIEALQVLGALGYVQAGRPLSCKSRAAQVSRAFNNAVIQRALIGQELSTLASPVLGCGMALNLIDQLFLLAHQNQPKEKDAPAFVWSKLKAMGRRLNHEGKTLEDDESNLARLRELGEIFTRDTSAHLPQSGPALTMNPGERQADQRPSARPAAGPGL